MNDLGVVAVSVGNTRTAVARFDGASGGLHPAGCVHVSNSDPGAIVAAVSDAWEQLRQHGGGEEAVVAVASVNEPVSAPLLDRLREEIGEPVHQIGEEIAVPIGIQMDAETLTGVDRLLNGAAAWAILKSACAIVDAGTAVTVDFVDGVGTFQGGAIAPGARMQLDSLHERTAALPEVPFAAPEAEAFGKNTAQAMLQGVFHGIRGLVWKLVERYAESYGAYPTVIATGGDAAVLFADDELVDRVVPELTLIGIAVAVRSAE